jgi:hypothetical protein
MGFADLKRNLDGRSPARKGPAGAMNVSRRLDSQRLLGLNARL